MLRSRNFTDEELNMPVKMFANFTTDCFRVLDGQERHDCVLSFDNAGFDMVLDCCANSCIIGKAGKKINLFHEWEEIEKVDFFMDHNGLIENISDDMLFSLKPKDKNFSCTNRMHPENLTQSPKNNEFSKIIPEVDEKMPEEDSIIEVSTIPKNIESSFLISGDSSTPILLKNSEMINLSSLATNINNNNFSFTDSSSCFGSIDSCFGLTTFRSPSNYISEKRKNQLNFSEPLPIFFDSKIGKKPKTIENKNIFKKLLSRKIKGLFRSLFVCKNSTELQTITSNMKDTQSSLGVIYGGGGDERCCKENYLLEKKMSISAGCKDLISKTFEFLSLENNTFSNYKLTNDKKIDINMIDPKIYFSVTVFKKCWRGEIFMDNTSGLPVDAKRFQYWFEIEEYRAKNLHEFLVSQLAHKFIIPKNKTKEYEVTDISTFNNKPYNVEMKDEEPIKYLYATFTTLENHVQFSQLLLSTIFNIEIITRLQNHFPYGSFMHPLKLVFSTAEHGRSLMTVLGYFSALSAGPCIIGVRESSGTVFGAVLSHSLTHNKRFYGTRECSVYSKKTNSSLQIYNWSGKNTHFIHLTRDSFQIGGGGHGPAIYIHENIINGRSVRSETFENEVLSDKSEFTVNVLECWKFV